VRSSQDRTDIALQTAPGLSHRLLVNIEKQKEISLLETRAFTSFAGQTHERDASILSAEKRGACRPA